MPFLWLWLALLCALGRGAVVPTSCSQQLNFFYQQLGLPGLFPVTDPVALVAGFDGPTPIVTATLNFQSVAQTYQAAIAGPPPTPLVSYVSFDLPWCVTQLNISCQGIAIHGLGKADGCLIVDFDQGGSSQVAGRIWVSVNQSCGSPSIIFYNVTLSPPATVDGIYTYNTQGLLSPYPSLGEQEAMEFYQNSTCAYSDGALADATAQGQFVCLAQRIGCADTRVDGEPGAPVVPIPQFQCVGNLTSNTSAPQYMVWSVSSYDLPGSVTGYFYLRFCAPSDVLCQAQFQQDVWLRPGSLTAYSLIAGTRRQFISPYTSFDQLLLISYNGAITSFAPTYTLAPNDEVARLIPCLCGFSVACDAQGQVFNESTSVSQVLDLDNALPLPYPGPSFEFPKGQSEIVLAGNSSYDPDQQPGLFNVYWKIYSQPAGSPAVVIEWPTLEVQQLNSSLYDAGTYLFLLYASDGQTVTFALLNVTVVNNVIIPICYMDDVIFIPYSGGSLATPTVCPGPGLHPTDFVIINGTLSISTNPAIPLTYLWVQTAGAPTPLVLQCVINGIVNTAQMWDETTLELRVTFQNIGLYGYNLTITDGEITASVDCQFYVLPDFLQPVGPPLILPNYTLPPIRNLTLIDAPVIQFENETYNLTPTVTLPPHPAAPNSTVPPLLPDYGPPTNDELFVLFMAWLVGFFCLLLVLLVYIVEKPGDQFSHLDHTEYTVDSF
jgi:hypothetical protein